MPDRTMTIMFVAPVIREVLERHGVSNVREGDTKHVWDSGSDEETEAAKALFNELVNDKGMRAYAVSKSGGQGEPVDEFMANAEALIFVAAIAGG